MLTDNAPRPITMQKLLNQMQLGDDGIYGYPFTNKEQAMEINLREKVATASYDNLIEKIAKHHSVPVMDFEVARFLRQIPSDGRVIDVGGCWGWHWRLLKEHRPNIQVFIVDFVRANLLHAKALLGDAINEQIFLIHGDATKLNFPNESFDGYWSVQTLQHVVRFETAIVEAQRILKSGGVFANYSLNDQPPLRWLYRVLGHSYINQGWVEGSYWLARASGEQKQMIESILATKVCERWSEILYKPELHITFPGKGKSWLGHLDAALSNDSGFLGFIARQRSFHCKKP